MVERGDQGTAARCADIAELLPFYLNGTLEPERARRVRDHLAACAVCRREEIDARAARDLFAGHLPVGLLLDYALHEPLPGRSLRVVESHLAVCGRCSQEVATVRGEHAEPEGVSLERRQEPPESLRGMRILALAAGLAAVVATAGWIWTWQQLVEERLGSALRTNLPVVELLPATPASLRHGGATDPRTVDNRVELPTTARELVLVLLSGGQGCESGCVLEVYAAGESEAKRRIEELAPSPDGHLTLTLSADWIPPGRSILAVRDQASGELLVQFRVEILRSSG